MLQGAVQSFQKITQLVPEADLAAPIPASVIAAIKAAPNRGIFNVSNNETYTGQVLKCEELVLSQDAELTLTSLTDDSVPWVAIVAKKWKFIAPQKRALIRRIPNPPVPGAAKGTAGANGAPGPSDNQGGSDGSQGGQGETGKTKQMAKLYLFGERTVDQPGNPIPWMNLMILLSGIMGGEGGEGGDGGAGGNGAQGNPGSDQLFGCARGPGDGGPGGRGGQGGTGGTGGVGGDGGTVIYAGPSAFLDIITFANLINVSGNGGFGGSGGRGGTGGAGGPRGANTTYCHGGSPGRSGSRGPWGIDGSNGADGQKGSADVSPRSNLNDLY